MALLTSWLGQAEQVPLDDGEHSFHALTLRWMLAWTEANPAATGWPMVRRFLDHLEANADEFWEVPALELGARV
jgi:hypothetical protein